MTAIKKETNKNNEWKELCNYIKKEILEYDDNMKFPKMLALRLQGLKKGEYIANNNQEVQACYDDKTILVAFKLCKNKIISYLHNNEKKIKDENHKINLIMKIVEPEINEVYLRFQENKTIEDRVANTSYDNQLHNGAGYIKKTKEINDKMKNLF